MLTATDEHRPVNLHTIDVDAVLVERTTTDIVLTAQLVMSADTSLRGNKLFYCVAACRGHSLQVLLVELLHRTHLPSRLCYSYFGELFSALSHHDVERKIALRLLQDALSCLVAYHGVNDHYTIGSVEGEVVLPVERSSCAKRLAFDANLTQRHGVVAVIYNPSLQVHLSGIGLLLFLLSRYIHNAPKERQKKQ